MEENNERVMAEHTHLDNKDHIEHANGTLLVLVEKCKYAHEDLSIRPFIMIQTAGNPGDETEINSIHLVMLDLDGIRIRQQTKLKFLNQPNRSSYGQILEKIGLTASSPLTLSRKNSHQNHLIYK